MNEIIHLLSGPMANALARTLLHSIWQAGIISILLWVVLGLTPTNKPDKRYNISVAALITVIISLFLTFSIIRHTPPATVNPLPSTVISSNTPDIQTENTTYETIVSEGSISPQKSHLSWATYTLIVWAGGSGAMLIRLAFLFSKLGRIRQNCLPINTPEILQIANEIRYCLKLKQNIRILACSTINSPAVIGILSPAILLPLSVISGTSPETLKTIKAIIAHEMAHIKRHDYLFNIIQLIVESFLFFNPAVWLISRQIRSEREACCDTIAAVTMGTDHNYAQLLLDWIINSHSTSQMAGMRLAFSSNKNQTIERARRMLIPGYKPQINSGLTRWLLALIITIAVSWALLLASDATITFAGKILSPEQAVEIMTELESTHGKQIYNPEDSNYHENNTAYIKGTVLTWDNRAVDCNMIIDYYGSNKTKVYINSGSLNSRYKELDITDPDYNKFEAHLEPGKVYIYAEMEGYAPYIYGPFMMSEGQQKEDITITLQPGFCSAIEVVDENNNPIANAKLYGRYQIDSSSTANMNLTTDIDGKAEIKNAIDNKFNIVIIADGMEETSFTNIKLSPDTPLVLKLHPTLPAKGRVISAIDNKPVPNARILLACKNNHQRYTLEESQRKLIATSNDSGTFYIDHLKANQPISIYIEAPGFGYKHVDNITAGDSNIEIKLDKPLIIKGEITGPLDTLPAKNNKPSIKYKQGISINTRQGTTSTTLARPEYAEVTTTGNKATFEIINPWGNIIEIGTGSYYSSINLEKEVPALLSIDLSNKLTPDGKPYQQKPITISFDLPKESAKPTGTIKLYSDDINSKHQRKYEVLEIHDGIVQTTVQAPGKITCSIGNTSGCFFHEYTTAINGSTTPMNIIIPAYPAGMIFGNIFEQDGSAASGLFVSINTVNDHEIQNLADINNKSGSSFTQKYAISPIPIGGTYTLTVHRSNCYITFPKITLPAHEPIKQLDITMPETIAITGIITNSDNTPAAWIPYHITFTDSNNHGFSFYSDSQRTDNNGCFIITEINPNADGEYYIEIESGKDYKENKTKITDFSKPLSIKLQSPD